jgi:hypothetical protein
MAEEGNLGTVAWREVLAETTARMDEAGLPIVEARWIVEEAGGFDPTDEGSGLDDLVTERGMFRHDDLLRRRMAGEPLQYVFGHWSFRTLDLMVDPRVLIPRPETEAVVGHALDEFDRVATGRSDGVRVADLGTGSGASACRSPSSEPSPAWCAPSAPSPSRRRRGPTRRGSRIASRPRSPWNGTPPCSRPETLCWRRSKETGSASAST